ncbi:terpene synthase [Streptomyces sp. NPDC017979]|uniref:labda-7,13(16),14-triene synthase n=1 Tax=Streptomyces sp. NPDC017979 TaxID=3365024 RepID=UPI0037B4CE37
MGKRVRSTRSFGASPLWRGASVRSGDRGEAAGGGPWEVPDFWGLFPSRISPLAGEVESGTRGWLDGWRLVEEGPGERLKASKVGRLVALAYPDAQADLLRWSADLFAWLTAFDDVHVEAPRVTTAELAPHIASFVGVLETGTAPGTAPTHFPAALAELLARARELLTPLQDERVRARLDKVFVAMLWETTTRERTVSTAEYETMRPHTFFSAVGATLVEPCAGLDLSPAARADPEVRRLTQALATLWGRTNDLYSFAYEQRALGSVPRTLPWLIARERGLPLDAAFAEAGRWCAEEAVLAHRLIGQLSSSPREGVSEYARAIAHAIGGTRRLYEVSDRWRKE